MFSSRGKYVFTNFLRKNPNTFPTQPTFALVMHTYPIIDIIDNCYLIPQLQRERRISVLLPHDYHETDKSYSVLYLHDGQNLFDDYAPYGNWGVDKTLALMAAQGMKDLIVVAIDHGGELRIKELLPFRTSKFKESEGEKYLDFMMNTLKPMVQNRYRVKVGREFTGIGGSSLGGLISLYAGFNYSNVFGKLMIFSPSLWVSSRIYEAAKHIHFGQHTDLYLYAGGLESANHLANVETMNEILHSKQNLRMKFISNPEGKHQEYFWGEQFPIAAKWLFYPEG